MANERTLLAYVRTAFAFLAGALTIAHLFETPEASASAAVLTIAGVLVLGIGALRYRSAGRLLNEMRASMVEDVTSG